MADRVQNVIISDVHIGSPYSLTDLFRAFIDSLPPETALVLNGDTLDRSKPIQLTEANEALLDMLRRESVRRHVIWVRGNHDDRFAMESPEAIDFVNCHAIGKRLFVAHGYDFDNVMPRNWLFIKFFRLFHMFRVALGAESVHVAYYAKKFGPLYRFLRRHVAVNAVEYAREQGFEAVTCGHTHYVEDVTVDGVRYINTGSWTEEPVYCLAVREHSMGLVPVEETAAWRT